MSAAVVGEHWHDRRQGHSCGNRSSKTDPTCGSCIPAYSSARDAGHTDADLEVAVWSENQSSEVRKAAAKALGKLGEHAASAVPALKKCLADKEYNVRRGGW